MPTNDRRDAAGRRANSRGPKILRFESLEGRQLLSASTGAKSPDLVAVAFRSDPYGDWGKSVTVAGTIRNQGDADASSPFKVDVYVSATADRSAGAVRVGSIAVDGLEKGEETTFEQEVDLPPTALPRVGADGAVYLGLVVDAGDAVPESNTANNLDRGPGIDASTVLIVPDQSASLAVRSLTLDGSTAEWGDSVKVTARVENTLGGPAPASTVRVVLTPPGVAVGSGQEVTLVGELEVPELLPYQSVDVTGTVRLPAGPPLKFPVAGGFIARAIADAGHDVNPLLAPPAPQGRGIDWEILSIASDPPAKAADPNAPRPDLLAADVLTPGATLTWGGTFQVAATVTNRGAADAGPVTLRYLLAGPNGELTNALVLGHATIEGGLKAGASTTTTQTLKLPGKLPFGMQLGNGLGRIVVQVDPLNEVEEADEANGLAASAPMTLALPTAQAPDSPYGASQTLTPTPAESPTPTRPTGNRADQQQRVQAYRTRLQAFRSLLDQRRQGLQPRGVSRPAQPPRGPQGTTPRNNA